MLPPTGHKIKLIIDSDAKNEIDDQYAIAFANLSPERFDIQGFVGSNFDNDCGGPDGIKKSVDEINVRAGSKRIVRRWGGTARHLPWVNP